MKEPSLLDRAFDGFVRYTKRPIWGAVNTLSGKRMQMPLEIYDFGMYRAAFDASAEAAQRRIGSSQLKVIEHAPGRTLLHVTAFDHRDPGILLPYREIAIDVPVEHSERRVRGFAVLHLPVTTEDARWAGVANFGFPKFVANIDITRDERGDVEAMLEAEGVHVLTLLVDALPTRRDRQLTITNFTLRDDDNLVESDFHVEAELGVSTARGGARLELGPHAIAAGLRELDVALHSQSHEYAPRAHARLTKGRVIGERFARAPAEPRAHAHVHPA